MGFTDDGLKQVLMKMEAEGLVRIKEYNEDDQPVYELTDKGKQYAKQVKEQKQ